MNVDKITYNTLDKMREIATILFDDSKNDLRALPKTVRLQILTTLSFIWSTAFTLLVFGQMYGTIWMSLVVGHIAIIIATYYTFRIFYDAKHTPQKFITPVLNVHTRYGSHGRGIGGEHE